jgi:hypothetical protein
MARCQHEIMLRKRSQNTIGFDNEQSLALLLLLAGQGPIYFSTQGLAMAGTGSKGRSAPRAANAVPQNGLLRTKIASISHAHNTVNRGYAARRR